jgi:hypothetical protein
MSNEFKKEEIHMQSFDNENEEECIEVRITGYSKMPFWKHDLKLKAVIALLGTVDIKDYFESEMYEDLEIDLEEIKKLLKNNLSTL